LAVAIVGRTRNIIGYGVTEDEETRDIGSDGLPIPGTGTGRFDVNKPFYGPTDDAVDIWIGYTRQLTDDVTWRIQLNLRDALSDGDVSFRSTPTRRLPPPCGTDTEGRRWEITNTLEFLSRVVTHRMDSRTIRML
jgi:hypothetical protein